MQYQNKYNDEEPLAYTSIEGLKEEILIYPAEWFLIREKRDKLLQESDWTQLPDVPLTTKEEWATYRQKLRDITDQSDPFNIVWPIPPV